MINANYGVFAQNPTLSQIRVQLGYAIIQESGLSFLGLGDPNLVSWGSLLSEAQERIGASVWLALFPGMALSLLVLCVNLFGDGINDVLNPKLRKK